jgi:hypothetical protein
MAAATSSRMTTGRRRRLDGQRRKPALNAARGSQTSAAAQYIAVATRAAGTTTAAAARGTPVVEAVPEAVASGNAAASWGRAGGATRNAVVEPLGPAAQVAAFVKGKEQEGRVVVFDPGVVARAEHRGQAARVHELDPARYELVGPHDELQTFALAELRGHVRPKLRHAPTSRRPVHTL